MKNKRFAIFGAALLVASTMAFANNESVQTALSFIAPSVYDVSNIEQPDAGLIVYDTSDNLFKAKLWGPNAGWHVLSPTATVSQPVTISSSTTLTAAEDVVLANAGSGVLTISLPTAANGGKIYQIKKIDSTLNAITIDPAGSETVDGASSTTLNTRNESLTLVSDGTNWQIIDRNIPSEWTAYTPTLTGFGTATSVFFISRRVGDSLEIRGKFTSGTSTAVEAQATMGFDGTNANVTSDSTKVPSIQLSGDGTYSVAGTSHPKILVESNVGYLTFGLQASGNAGLSKINGNVFLASGQGISFHAIVPIAGWKN